MGGGGDVSLLSVIAGSLACAGAFDCNLDFDNYGGIILWLALMIYMFKALGIICDEYFVPSLEVIVDKLQLSNDVAGATFMAAGSSAPEFFTSLVATFVIVSEGGVGTIVGSAIFNILVIVGVTGYVACAKQDLYIWWYPLTRDTFFYSLAIVEVIVVLIDEEVMWYEGLIMTVTYVFYCVYMKFNPAIVEKLGITNPSAVDVITVPHQEQVHVSTINGAREDDSRIEEKINGAPVEEKINGAPMEVKLNGAPMEVKINGAPMEQKITGAPEDDRPVEEVQDRSIDGLRKTADGEETVPGPPDHHLGIIQGEEGSGEHHSTARAPEEAPPEAPTEKVAPPRTAPPEAPLKVAPPRTALPEAPLSPPQELPLRNDSKEASLTVVDAHPANPCHLTVCEPGDTLSQRRPSWSLTEAEHKAKLAEMVQRGAEQPGEADLAACRSNERRCCRDPMVVFFEYSMPSAEKHCWLLFSLSILWIGVATYIMVDATDRTGKILHIPTLAMARVFLAAGTSIPDALGSIAVAKQGEGDMAVANALGSNVFDILIGLGIPWMVKTGFMGKEVSFEGKWGELVYDIFALIIVLVLFVGALVIHRWYLTRRVGILLLVFYIVFLIYNVLSVYVFKIVEVDED